VQDWPEFGLLLTGGGDIEAHRYGGSPNDAMYDMHSDRDEFEIELAREAARRRVPTLAICRGLQLLNVALGGTLIEDIPGEVGSMDHREIGHLVYNGHQHVRLALTRGSECDERVAAPRRGSWRPGSERSARRGDLEP